MTDDPGAGLVHRRRTPRWAPAVVGGLLTVVCLALVVQAMVSKWDAVSDRLAHANPAWLGAALALGALGMAWIAWVWADALRLVGARPRRRLVMAWYFVGELGKYLPGAIWAAVGRGELARRGGVPAGKAYPSVGLSLVGLYLAAAVVAAALVPFDLAHQTHVGAGLLVLLLVPAGLLVLHPRVLTWLLGHARRRTKRALDLPVPAWGSSIGLVARFVPAWACIGASTWLVARGLVPDASILRVVVATVLSWSVGFLTPTPSGAGVREGVFVAASGLPSAEGAAVAIASRLVFVVVDGLGALVAAPTTRAKPGAGPPVASLGRRDPAERQEDD